MSSIKRFVALLIMMCLSGIAMAEVSVTDVGQNLASATAGGSANTVQTAASTVSATGDVIDTSFQGATATAYTGKASAMQDSAQSVNGAHDVGLQTIHAANLDSKKGGSLSQSNDQNTVNSGDTIEFAANTGDIKGGSKAVYVSKQLNNQNGYGSEYNGVTGMNDLKAVTGPCGKVLFEQGNSKGIDPKIVIAWDQNSACVTSGTIKGNQWNNDVIGATILIDATEKNGATTSAWGSTELRQTDIGNYFGSGDIYGYSDNYAKSTAFFGDAEVSQKIKTDVNTNPWGTALPNQSVGLWSYNTADVLSILGDASANQDKNTNVHA
jgi:hypothetical protein